ncbi:hypothetical protein [Glycomyces salinus]|uniref:hypothetical protein n=1 Tax=Glycomyces salinus TaxID=980294 RepID=UPI0018EB0861|nr:hypothetical protein [Glycomyces salinus]
MTDEQRQLVRWHLRKAQVADRLIMGERYRVQRDLVEGVETSGFEDDTEAQVWLASNRRNLLALIELAVSRQWNFEAWALAEAMWAYFTSSGTFDEAERCYRMAAGAAEQDGDTAAQIRMSLLAAQMLTDARRFDEGEAALAEIRRTAEEFGDLVLQGTALEFTGRLFQKRRLWDEAISWFEDALSNARMQVRELDDVGPRVVALQQRFLGQCYLAQGEVAIASRHLENARQGFAEVGDRRSGLMLEIDAALLALRKGSEGAAERVSGALELARDKGMLQPMADGLVEFALLTANPRRNELLREALKEYESMGDPAAGEVRRLIAEEQ